MAQNTLTNIAVSYTEDYGTEIDEQKLAKKRAQNLTEALKDRFGGLPTYKEFCEEIDYEVNNLKEDFQLEIIDFGIAVFGDTAGMPAPDHLEREVTEINKFRKGKDLTKNEYVVIHDSYQDLLESNEYYF